MLFPPTRDKVMALAALAQAGKIVTQLAAEPQHDESALRASARSLLILHPQDMDQVFAGVDGLSLGLKTMQTLLKGQGLQSLQAKELIRYLMAMDQLADRLKLSASTQAVIGRGLEELSVRFSAIVNTDSSDQLMDIPQSEFDAFYEQLGGLYQKSLSQLPPQIIVRGAKGYLQDEASVVRVRTALFSGARAAYLWHQQGGRRWQLLFSRRAYAEMSARMHLRSV